MSHFALMNLFDHPWMTFEGPNGTVVRLPVGTIPTVIEENPEEGICLLVILAPSAEPLKIHVKGTSDEVLAQLGQGVRKINRVKGLAPVPLHEFQEPYSFPDEEA